MEAKSRPKPMVTCEICDQKILRTKLKQHLVECQHQNGGEIFKCSDCNIAFKTKKGLSGHISRDHSEPVKCPFQNCDSMLKNKACLSTHVKMVHEGLRDECQNCGKKISYGNLTKHMKSCKNDGSRPFQCSDEGCNATFRTFHERSNHIRIVHSERIVCPFSDCRVIMSKHNLPRHIKLVHEKLRDECKKCGKKISYGNLTRHVDLCKSDGSRPFLCTKEGCKASFKTFADRSNHISSVHSKRIECPLFPNCRVMMSKHNLSRHIKLVHKKLRDECKNCGKKITNLTRHLKSCTSNGSRPFECTEDGCDSTLRTSAEKSSHSSHVHSERIECPFPQGGASIKKQYFPKLVRTFTQQIQRKM